MWGGNMGGKTTDHWLDGYLGTYAGEESKGVYRFSFRERDGALTGPDLFFQARNAKWVSLYEDRLVIPLEKEGVAGICLLRLADGSIVSRDEVLAQAQTCCFILQEQGFIYSANYHDGTVMVYELKAGRPVLVKRIECGAGAGCHQILLHGGCLMVPCLTQHKICLFDRTRSFSPAGEISFPMGSGPRHGVFNATHTMLYVVSEWSNELFIFDVAGSRFTLRQALSILPTEPAPGGMGKRAAAAAIRLTGDERFLYLSIREQELLAVVDVTGREAEVIQHVPCGGKHPRDVILSPDNRFLLVLNRSEGGLISIRRDEHSGKLLERCGKIEVPEGVSIVLSQ